MKINQTQRNHAIQRIRDTRDEAVREVNKKLRKKRAALLDRAQELTRRRIQHRLNKGIDPCRIKENTYETEAFTLKLPPSLREFMEKHNDVLYQKKRHIRAESSREEQKLQPRIDTMNALVESTIDKIMLSGAEEVMEAINEFNKQVAKL